MSHISSLTILISDVPALEKACRERGVELRRDQKTFLNYGGRRSPCDMAIVLPGADKKTFEAGLVKTKDGYQIQMDNWGGGYGLNEKIGQNAGLLLQRYGINAARNAAVKQGMAVREVQMADGNVRLICEPKQMAVAGAGWGSGY